MNIQGIQAYLFSVPVRFKIARSNTRFSHHCISALTIEGVDGFGSGVLYNNRPLQSLRILRNEVIPFIENQSFDSLQAIRKGLHQRFTSRDSAIVYAIDSALWDIEGKMAGKPVNQLLGVPCRGQIAITEQIFIREEHAALEETRKILSHGTQQIKIKIGSDPERDIQLVKEIRSTVGDQITLGVDINTGYTFQQAVFVGEQLKELGVSVMEDPLPRAEWERLPALRQKTGIPVLLDADIRSLDDLERAIQMGAIDYLNIKLTRIGGLTAAMEYSRVCQEHSVGISIGCSEDLGMGMASILHLSSIIKALHSTEGVGSDRLGFDIIQDPFILSSGSLPVPDGLGLGVSFSMEKLHEVAIKKGFQIGDVITTSTSFYLSAQYNQWFQRWFTLWFRLGRKIQRRGSGG